MIAEIPKKSGKKWKRFPLFTLIVQWMDLQEINEIMQLLIFCDMAYILHNLIIKNIRLIISWNPCLR